MYADSGGLMFPFFRNFSQEVEELGEFCYSQKPTSSLDSVISTCTISDYDLGGEGDLFKAPEPIMEEQIVGLDPISAAIAMMMSPAASDDIIMPLPPVLNLKDGGFQSLPSEALLGEVSEKTAGETAVAEVKLPLSVSTAEAHFQENKPACESQFVKCGSSGSLSSMEWVKSGANVGPPHFLDFPELDFSAVHGMRRAFSEGDIKALGNGSINLIHSPIQRPLVIGGCTPEDRLQKLSRYRHKKSRRNFGRKIKYACRKALADSQPRIRGRFAKTEDADISK